LHKVIWEEFPETQGGKIEDLLHKVIREQSASTATIYYAPHERWYELRAYPTLDGISIYFRDVTRRIIAEATLRESEEKRRLALDAAELGAWNLNVTNRTLICDERYRFIRTGTTAPLSYDQALAHIHPDDRDRVMNAVTIATDPKAPALYTQEYRVVHVDGSVHWVLAKGRPHFVSDGGRRNLVSLDGTLADITEQKRAEQQILQQSAELALADRRKNEFIATLAHELRNPLAPIRNSLSIMELKGYDAQSVEKSRLVIERQVNQMVRLVDDLLDVSRISHGKLELKRQPVNLFEVIDSALESSKPMIDAAGLTLHLSLPPEPVYLNADPTRLAQILTNLLNNAAKFTDRDGRVDLTVERVEKADSPDQVYVKISVKDTGIGIPAEHLPSIFDAFIQLPGSIKRSQGGLGVGLMLVRRLIEMHGGMIIADSPGPGLGTTFTALLPILDQETSAESQSPDKTVKTTNKLRILIVDDNVDAANSLGVLMELLEHEIQVVHDGTSALQAAPEFMPQVIFLDIGLPDMTGYEVASRIRETDWGTSVKLYALTGWGQEEDRRKSQEAGFDAHLVKPIDPKKLFELISSLQVPIK
jgi:signal transduction histidine kinase/CheY-like chemotaxis protein